MTDDYTRTGAAGAGTVASVDEESSPSATERATALASTATDEAKSVAGAAVDQTRAVAASAADQARLVADDARDHARHLVSDARGQLRSQIDDQANRLTDSLGDVGHQLRLMSEKADDPQSPVTVFTRQAADSVDRMALRLQQGGVDQLVDDVRRFARNRPGVFLLGALSAGFVIGRLVKATDLGQVMQPDRGQAGDGDPATWAAEPDAGAFEPAPAAPGEQYGQFGQNDPYSQNDPSGQYDQSREYPAAPGSPSQSMTPTPSGAEGYPVATGQNPEIYDPRPEDSAT